MTKEEITKMFEQGLVKAPEYLTPKKVCKFSPLGRNRVYELIKNKEIRYFIFQGSYIILRDDLLNYLVEHCDDESRKTYTVKTGVITNDI